MLPNGLNVSHIHMTTQELHRILGAWTAFFAQTTKHATDSDAWENLVSAWYSPIIEEGFRKDRLSAKAYLPKRDKTDLRNAKNTGFQVEMYETFNLSLNWIRHCTSETLTPFLCCHGGPDACLCELYRFMWLWPMRFQLMQSLKRSHQCQRVASWCLCDANDNWCLKTGKLSFRAARPSTSSKLMLTGLVMYGAFNVSKMSTWWSVEQ